MAAVLSPMAIHLWLDRTRRGEKILRLPRTGARARSQQPHASVTASGTVTPSITTHTPGQTPMASGRASPAHPLPTGPLPRQASRAISTAIMLTNLVKSFLVFALSGYIHDQACYLALLHTSPPGDYTLDRRDRHNPLLHRPTHRVSLRSYNQIRLARVEVESSSVLAGKGLHRTRTGVADLRGSGL